MRKNSGGFPPRYFTLLRLALAAMMLRCVPWIPFCLAYFLPLGVWSKLLVVFCPALWFVFVGPARVAYGEIMAGYARDEHAPVRVRDLFSMNRSWWPVFRGRVQLAHRWALPLLILLVLMMPMLWFVNPFSAVKIILNVFSAIATGAATAAAALPRLMMGDTPVVEAGVLGGAIALAVVTAAALGLYLWGVFQTGAYRFGYTRMPKARDIKPLLKKNLPLWLPTLILFGAFAVIAYGELMLLFSNFISVETVFLVKFQPAQYVLAALTAASYLLLLPLRKRNTARWAAEHS